MFAWSATASIVLDEPLSLTKLIAAAPILAGLIVDIVVRRRNDRLDAHLRSANLSEDQI